MNRRDIVVIGTSAGGVNALTRLIKDLPSTLSASVFIIMHIHRQHPTLLQEILQRHTSLKIITPKDNEVIRQRCIYVAPPDFHMVMKRNRIHLTQGPRVNHCRPAIDPLFRSAALCYGARVVGIVLTGMLDDGTEGLEFIKKCGGLAVVQHPEDAEHADMPRNALANISVDYCVALSEMASLIARLTKASVKAKLKPLPQWMQVEDKENTRDIPSTDELNRLGKISSFSCPECQGTLWEIDKDKVLRYRCRVGHAFGPQSLLAVHDETLENILWSAVRALEENAEISQRIANYVNKRHIHTVSLFHHKAKIAKQNAERLKSMLLKTKRTKT